MSETSTAASQLLQSREPFFTEVDINTIKINCGDERPGGPEPYIHVFGGALNLAYNLSVMREVTEQDSVQSTFEAEVSAVTPVLLQTANLHYGVHSDSNKDVSGTVDINQTSGGVGCGYGEVRTVISQLISDRREEISDRAHVILPEFFSSSDDDLFAKHVFEAHYRLANNVEFFKNGGRAAVLAAIKAGAKSMVVQGDHTGKVGIINVDPNSTLLNSAAIAANLPTYDHDAWATAETYDRVKDIYPFAKRQLQQAEHLDTIGTMLALGVEEIVVRRAA